VKRRIEINIETRRTWVVRPAREQTFSFCGRCNEQVRMLSADEAAVIARVSPRVIYRWVEAGEIHFTETSGGLILICLDSLNRADEAAMSQSPDALNG
jgi:excisionase family DNA binding protein